MKKKALKSAFPNTIPVLAGYIFLGIAYGIYMKTSGFPVWYPIILGVAIFGGSLQFVAVEMLLSPFAPIQVLIMALLIHARHIFYGISMLEKYKGTGAKKLYLIYGLSDETFSVNYAAKVPDGVDKGWFMFFVTLLDQSYWVIGTALGAVLGAIINVPVKGIEFVMTALFVVIFVENWEKEKKHFPAIVGVLASAVSLFVFKTFFSPDNFLIPAMIGIVALLAAFRKPLKLDEEGGKEE